MLSTCTQPIILIFTFLLGLFPSPLRPTPSPMRFVTYNLRYDSRPDGISVGQSVRELPDRLEEVDYLGVRGEQAWSARRMIVAEQVMGQGVVVAGFQEALVRQVHDLGELFGEEWDWVGVGRDDGKKASEFSPIFYKKTELKLTSWDTFWLSKTPATPSRYPGAGSLRLCTVAAFETIPPSPSSSQSSSSPKTFTVLNTHLDDQSEDARQVGVSLIMHRARYEAHTTHAPVFLLGDLNSPAEGEDTGAHRIVTGVEMPWGVNASFADKYAVSSGSSSGVHHPQRKGNKDKFGFRMLDLRGEAPREKVSNAFATFTGFTNPGDAREWKRIDFIFGGDNGGWSAEGYRVLDARGDDGTLASDHRPVFADIAI